MKIRKALSRDADALWTLRNRAILTGCAAHYPADLLQRWIEGEITDKFRRIVIEQFWLIEQAQHPLACGMITTSHPTTANAPIGQLDAIFVDPKAMGQGAGKAMIGHLEQLGRDAGLTELTLEATLNAAPFYRRCGFIGETVEQYPSPRGFTLDCIPMVKPLK
ncbi:GNAT family N-acetyltransferase [Ferrimonas pelagia]|uniref:GNAT family N-acetyltransferase n=1 Tax=Ferrimonas pelagia TaxID=1177826 RepID=A0ABP9EK14_9GAMM